MPKAPKHKNMDTQQDVNICLMPGSTYGLRQLLLSYGMDPSKIKHAYRHLSTLETLVLNRLLPFEEQATTILEILERRSMKSRGDIISLFLSADISKCSSFHMHASLCASMSS